MKKYLSSGLTLTIISVFLQSQTVLAAEYLVSSASEILSANPLPGDTLIMSDGDWIDEAINFSAIGTSTDPITLRAQTPGEVVLSGVSTLNISGEWLIVSGLRFENGGLSDGAGAIVDFRGSLGDAMHCRFTNSAIINYNAANIDDRYHWVKIRGQHNRVDHSRFEGHNHSGVTVVVDRDTSDPDFHLIDANHFLNRLEGNGNGFETVRIGTGAQALSDSYTIVENNLFESNDGEIEIVSNKSGNNIYRYNTFIESAGTLTLRNGHEALVEGNFFLGGNKNRTGGIRVIGERHTIINNYIANVDDRADGAISISVGNISVENPNPTGAAYLPVRDVVIAHNTIVNTLGTLVLFDHGLGSDGRDILAENVVFANNLLSSSNTAIFEGQEGNNWTWEGNIVFGGSLGPKDGHSGIEVNQPLLVQDSQGLYRPSLTSPAIDSSDGDYSGLITHDMDGQVRNPIFDVGADEYAVTEVVRGPLTMQDVGPAWLNGGATPAPAFIPIPPWALLILLPILVVVRNLRMAKK